MKTGFRIPSRLLFRPFALRNQALPSGAPNGVAVRPPFPPPGRLMGPKAFSYLAMLSCKANNRRLACSGAKTIRDFTLALGTPGSTRIKSMTTSALECVMIARFA